MVKTHELEDGEERRQMKKLYKYDYDQNGLRKTETRRRFSLFASHTEIGRESEALASYFVTVMGLAGIVLCYCILASFSFWDFKTHGNKFNKDYILKVVQNGTADFGHCAKFWPVSNAYTRVSLGTFCQRGKFNNPLNCAAICEINDAKFTNECAAEPRILYQNHDMPAETYTFFTALINAGHIPFNDTFGPGDPCWAFMPCARQYDHGEQAPDGHCNCCEFRKPFIGELEQIVALKGPGFAAGVHQDEENIFDMWYLYMLIYFAYAGQYMIISVQKKLSVTLDMGKVSAADYAVFVQNCGQVYGAAEIDQMRLDLMDYACHWGAISQCSPLTSIGFYMTIAKDITALERTKAELLERKATGSHKGLFALIYHLMFGGGTDVDKSLKAIDEKLEKKRAAMQSKLDKKHMIGTGSAIILFEDQRAAINFVNDHSLSHATSFLLSIPLLGPLVLKSFGTVLGIPMFRGRHLNVERSCEPNDVAYESTTTWGFRRWLLDNMADAATILIIGIAAGVQFGLEYWKRTERDRLKTLQVTYSVAGSDSTASVQNRVRVQSISTFCSIIVVILNMGLKLGVTFIVDIENKPTRTQMEQSMLWKLSVAYIVNSFIIPVAAATVTTEGKQSWYVIGGLATECVSLQVSNAIIPAVLQIVNPMRTLRLLTAKCAKTPAMIDQMLAPEDFLVSSRLADALKTFALGVLYCPIMPISPYIALGSLVLQYFVDKGVAIYLAARPIDMGAELLKTASTPMFAVQIALLAFSGFAFFAHRQEQAKVYLIIGFVTIFMLYFFPWRIFKCSCFAWCSAKEDHHAAGLGADTVRYMDYLQRLGPVDAKKEGRYMPQVDYIAPEVYAAVELIHEIGYLKAANPDPYPGQSTPCVGAALAPPRMQPAALMAGPVFNPAPPLQQQYQPVPQAVPSGYSQQPTLGYPMQQAPYSPPPPPVHQANVF